MYECVKHASQWCAVQLWDKVFSCFTVVTLLQKLASIVVLNAQVMVNCVSGCNCYLKCIRWQHLSSSIFSRLPVQFHVCIQHPAGLLLVCACLQSTENSVPTTDWRDQVQVLSWNEEVYRHSKRIPGCWCRHCGCWSDLSSNGWPQCQPLLYLLLQGIRALQETQLCAGRIQGVNIFV